VLTEPQEPNSPSGAPGPAELPAGAPAGRPLPGPVYAFAGASDMIVARLRALAARAPEVQEQVQRTAAELPDDLRRLRRDLPEDLRELGQTLPGQLQSLLADLPSYAAQVPGKARNLDRDAVTTTIRQNASEAQAKAQETYAALVRRGEGVVQRTKPGS
jgi:hypothetical protein